MSLVTFIIPSLGRDTLRRTIQSLKDQTDGSWKCMLILDCLENPILFFKDTRIWVCNTAQKLGRENHGGVLRNIGIYNCSTEWIAFVDDDDTVDEHYVQWLRKEGNDVDVLVFKMKSGDKILPESELACGEVGISFAVRREFLDHHHIEFVNSQFEDWEMIQELKKADARIRISEHVAYYVRP